MDILPDKIGPYGIVKRIGQGGIGKLTEGWTNFALKGGNVH
jgi:hypothetical protein